LVCVLGIFKIEACFLSGLISNHDLPDLCLLSR
jgi:hypothetical protein